MGAWMSLEAWLAVLGLLVGIPGGILALKRLWEESKKRQTVQTPPVNSQPKDNICIDSGRKPKTTIDNHRHQESFQHYHHEGKTSLLDGLPYIPYILIGIIIVFVCYVTLSWLRTGMWPSLSFLLRP